MQDRLAYATSGRDARQRTRHNIVKLDYGKEPLLIPPVVQ